MRYVVNLLSDAGTVIDFWDCADETEAREHALKAIDEGACADAAVETVEE